MNKPKLRRRHFLNAQRLISQIDERIREDAKCALWKKCTMLLSFNLPQTKNKIMYAYNSYFHRGKMYEFYECALNIGNELLYSGDFINSYKYLMQAYDGFLSIKSRKIYVANNSLGIYFMLRCEYENALQHFDRVNVGSIEPFCAYTVQINRCNALLHTNEVYEAYEVLNDLSKNAEALKAQDMTIIAVHYHLARAFYFKRCNELPTAHNELIQATRLCDQANENFKILYETCVLLSNKWGIMTCEEKGYSLVSRLCSQYELTIGDIMCWR